MQPKHKNMSCQVYKTDTNANQDELEEIANSHNGLLYGLVALCKEPLPKISNDVIISLEEVEKGILNFSAPTLAHLSNQAYIAELKSTRPDHLEAAFEVLKTAQEGQFGLTLS